MLKNNWIRIIGVFVLFIVIGLGNIARGQGSPCPTPSPEPSPGPSPTPIPNPRTLTFINNCGEPIWVGGSNASSVMGEATGFGLTPNTCSSNTDCTIIDPSFTCNSDQECVDSSGNPANTNTITVPGNLTSADFWPRTGCTFPCTTIPCCDTGDCASAVFGCGIQCNGGTKSPPANSFEVDMNLPPGNDFYDITNVDGFAVGIELQQVGGTPLPNNPTINGTPAPQLNCGSPSCPSFDMSKCPPELSQTTSNNLQVCWSLGDAANNAGQRGRDPSDILTRALRHSRTKFD